VPPNHSLLRRQLKRHFPGADGFAGPWTEFLAAVDAAYAAFDDDRAMLERSLDLSSHELLQANSEMRALFQAIPDLLFRVDARGVILSFKVGAGDDPLLHAQRAEQGQPLHQTVLQPIGPRFLEVLRQVLSAKNVQNIEFVFPQEQKRLVYEVRLMPVLKGEALVIIRNITERKLLEEQLLQSQKMEAVGQLAGGVAHDFNNLLTVILGNLSLLEIGAASEAEAKGAIADSLAASHKAADLTRQLLTFSRREPVALVALDLNEVVAEMTRLFQRLVGEHITIQTTFTPGGIPVLADAGMIEQLLMNLVVNSRDAMPKGGRLHLQTADVTLDAAAVQGQPQRRPGRYVVLAVSDTGSGIAAAHLAHIFEPFYTTKEPGKGTGLGLATVFGIVQQHRGWIEVESQPGDGTVFRVYLPRLDATAQLAAQFEAVPDPLVGGTELILLVEDEELVRRMMKELLERYGYRVQSMENGAKAYAYYLSARPKIDLLVTDMVMPGGMNGKELADLLRAQQPDLKVLLCSGYTDEFAGPASPHDDAAGFLSKPFDMGVLLRRIRERLDSA